MLIAHHHHPFLSSRHKRNVEQPLIKTRRFTDHSPGLAYKPQRCEATVTVLVTLFDTIDFLTTYQGIPLCEDQVHKNYGWQFQVGNHAAGSVVALQLLQLQQICKRLQPSISRSSCTRALIKDRGLLVGGKGSSRCTGLLCLLHPSIFHCHHCNAMVGRSNSYR